MSIELVFVIFSSQEDQENKLAFKKTRQRIFYSQKIIKNVINVDLRSLFSIFENFGKFTSQERHTRIRIIIKV